MEKTISDIKKISDGSASYLIALVKSIRQTSGPTVFELKDDTGSIKATGFSKAGERAYPDILIGQKIKAKVTARERNGQVELEILSYEKLADKEVLSFEQDFMIRSGRLEKLRPKFKDAARLILDAIDSSRQIVIRHHDDVDGYCSGLALEKAILPLLPGDKPYLYLSRSSSRSPYYDYTDALRDLNNYLISKTRYDGKAPLIILCDLGSNSQSIRAIKRLSMYGIDFIIVDHHRYHEINKVSVKVFLNSEEHGHGGELCAGCLASELAVMINPGLSSIKHFPALAGTADKMAGEEYGAYLKISGFSKDDLEAWSLVVDHELYMLKFQESSDILDDLFFPGKRNKEIISLLFSSLKSELLEVKKAAEKNAKISQINGFKLIELNRDSAKYSEYASSKLPRIAHTLAEGPRITMVLDSDAISFRADYVEKFSVISLIDLLSKKLPHALIDGGGHDFAGTLMFTAASREEVIKEVYGYINAL